MRVFVDTNVLLYRFDSDSPGKQAVSRAELRRLVVERSILLSTQVLQEFYVASTRKLKRPLSEDQAATVVEYLSRLPVVQVAPATIKAAIALHRAHALSFWDALIVRSAVEGGADAIYSEDMQDGQELAGVRIVNPFAAVRGGRRR